MFFHNFIYRLKCILRDKQTMFWTFLFPILMATFFNLAFSNLSSADKFTKIKIGIVNNDEYNKNTEFKTVIESVSKPENKAGKDSLFDVKYTSKDNAEKLLLDSKIEGYIYLDNEIKLVVNKSGLNQTIIKSFLDDYKQSTSTITTIIKNNPQALQELGNKISQREDYLKEVSISKGAPDSIVGYFYALIAMTCLYGSFIGLKEITALQANQSYQGARVNMAPVHKFKIFLASMTAAAIVQLTEIFALLAYLKFVVNISFGNQIGYIILTCLIGTITGVTFGTFVSSIIKKGEGMKVAILLSTTMTMSFLSGMMYDKIKYIIRTNVPVLGYLNPVNLISDSLYSLYYYNTHVQYFKDIIGVSVFAVIFSIGTYLVLRRQKYASL